jgi:single-stranded DNA-binding protein
VPCLTFVALNLALACSILHSYAARCGAQVRVVGKLSKTEWVDKSQVQRSGVRVIATEIALIRRRPRPQGSNSGVSLNLLHTARCSV